MELITKNLIKLQAGRTLRAFAEYLGIGQSTLHNYLRGRDPSAKYIIKICKKTGCDANWLLGIRKKYPDDITDYQMAQIKATQLEAFIKGLVKKGQKILKNLG